MGVAGGIVGLPNVGKSTLFSAFTRKGRFSDLLAEIPVALITNPKVGLLGAAEAALRLVTAPE